jgi:hypothetical protein
MRRPWVPVALVGLAILLALGASGVRGQHRCEGLGYRTHVTTRYQWTSGCEVFLVNRWIPERNLVFRQDGVILEMTRTRRVAA